MATTLHYTRELAKLIRQASKADKVAIATTLEILESRGPERLDTKSIRKKRGLKEILIDAENRYRIFFTQDGDMTHCWSYCKKTSPEEQERAIDRAIQRMP